METYKLNFLYLLRLKFCVAVYAVANAVMLLFMMYRVITLPRCPAINQISVILEFTSVIFIMFLFVSHYYFSKARAAELIESVSVTHKGRNGFYLSQLSVMITLVFITFAISFLLSIIYAFRDRSTDVAYFLYSIKISFLYFFLADIIAVLIGMLCSGIKKTSVAYIILIVFGFLFSPLTNNLTGMFYDTGEVSVYPIWKLFEIYPKYFMNDNRAYGFAANSKTLSIIMLWIGLLALMIALSLCLFRTKKQKIITTVSCLLVFIFSFAGALAPFSEAPQDSNSFLGDTEYYLSKKHEEFVIQKNEKPDFEITSYDMKLDIRDELKGEVTISVDKANLDEYRFTLYHGYKIKRISDSSGKKLKFDRDGDYVTVYPSSSTDTLTFKYKGHSAKFYSNSQGSCLPSGFAYYPINGFRYVYDTATACQGRVGTKLSEPVKMRVEVKCRNKMFCNLDKTDKNLFEGISDGLTLVSGFYKEMIVDDTRLIYQCYNNEELVENVDNYEELLKGYLNDNPNFKGKTIIVIPNSHSPAQDERRFESYDHIISYSVRAAFYESPISSDEAVKARLDLLYAYMKYYDKDSELYKLTQMNIEDLPQGDDDLNVILAKKIIESNDDIFVDVINAQNDRDNEDVIDLAKSIGDPIEFGHPTN